MSASPYSPSLINGLILPEVGETFTFKTFTRTIAEYRYEVGPNGYTIWLVYKPAKGHRRAVTIDKWIRWITHNGPRLEYVGGPAFGETAPAPTPEPEKSPASVTMADDIRALQELAADLLQRLNA